MICISSNCVKIGVFQRTPVCAASWNTVKANVIVTPGRVNIPIERIGSCAHFVSTITNAQVSRMPPTTMAIIRGWVHAIFCPPISSGIMKLRIERITNTPPRKSIRLSLLDVLDSGLLSSRGFGFGSTAQHKMTATEMTGHWTRKLQRHPIVSARNPPNGPPTLRPTTAMTLI